jgi:hypothetical protein
MELYLNIVASEPYIQSQHGATPCGLFLSYSTD